MKKSRKIAIIIVFMLIFLVCLYLALFCSFENNGITFIESLFGHGSEIESSQNSLIFELLRYPRAIKAIIAGSCLSLAGLFMQSVTKNPLAEPYITGISSGAALAIVISILFVNGANYPAWGFVGAFLSSLAVILFAGLNKFSVVKLILVGLCVNIFVSSLISLLILTNGEKAYPLMLILSGGLGNDSIISNKYLILLYLAVMAVCIFIIPKLNFLRLDADLVKSIGKKHDFYIFFAIILSSFLASLSVFAAGIIGFVGIIIPQLSKMIIGQDFRWLFVLCILSGSSLMLFSDYLSRIILYPLEVPLGLVIAFIGAPIFIFFLTKKGGVFYD